MNAGEVGEAGGGHRRRPGEHTSRSFNEVPSCGKARSLIKSQSNRKRIPEFKSRRSGKLVPGVKSLQVPKLGLDAKSLSSLKAHVTSFHGVKHSA
jgi:hypothetical protein